MKIIRNYLNNVKPNFVGEGKYTTWFHMERKQKIQYM